MAAKTKNPPRERSPAPGSRARPKRPDVEDRSQQAPDDAKSRLVAATIQAIAREGLEGLSVRAIVDAAGVNIAAVNYHFGTKENLLQIALESTLHEGVEKTLPELDDAIAEAGGNVRAALTPFLMEFFRNAMNYPGVAAAHYRGLLRGQDYGGVVPRMQRFFEGFFERIRPAFGSLDEAAARASTAQILMALNLLSLAPKLFDKLLQHPLDEHAGLEVFIERLLAVHLPQPAHAPRARVRKASRSPS